jgi:hypothetical protein
MPTVRIDLQRMAQQPDIGIALAWVMVLHDISTLLQLQAFLSRRIGRQGASRNFLESARFYANRCISLVINEAVAMTIPTRGSSFVMSLINEWQDAKESFQRLSDMARAGRRGDPNLNLIREMRNRGTAHYFDSGDQQLPALLEGALGRLLEENITTAVEESDPDGQFRNFAFVDSLFVNVMARDIWEAESSRSVEDVSRLVVTLARDVEAVGQPIGIALLKRFQTTNHD